MALAFCAPVPEGGGLETLEAHRPQFYVSWMKVPTVEASPAQEGLPPPSGLRGLGEAGEAGVPSCLDEERLDDSPKVTQPRALARNPPSLVLARVSSTGTRCHNPGLPIARFIWPRGLPSLEGPDCRDILS